MDYNVRRYEQKDFEQWNAFVADAANATFLFDRNFMDYHADRFPDFSLIISKNDKWLAILPAHLDNKTLSSHFGLTYGGLVHGKKMRLPVLIDVFEAMLRFLADRQIDQLKVKTIPPIYHQKPADGFLYALFLVDAKLVRRDVLSVIDNSRPVRITKTRRESIRRGGKNKLEIREEPDFGLFWDEILIPNLARKHAVKPVHTLAEIEKLHRHFPQNIRHFNVYHNNRIVGGTTVFISENVAHPQYISGEENKNALGTLDFLYHHLITDVFKDKRFFDFGISNEEQGRKLNEGLVFWKESFGAGPVTQDFYEVDTANHVLLKNVLI